METKTVSHITLITQNPWHDQKVGELIGEGGHGSEVAVKQYPFSGSLLEDFNGMVMGYIPRGMGTRKPKVEEKSFDSQTEQTTQLEGKENALVTPSSAGYANLATIDAGYFGRGYHSDYEVAYSKSKGVLNWVASFSPLPVVDEVMDKLEENQPHFSAQVVFDSVALLVELRPEGLGLRIKSPALSPVMSPPLSSLSQQKTTPQTMLKKEGSIKIAEELKLESSSVQVPGESIYFEGLLAFQHVQYKKAHVCFEQAAAEQYPAAYLYLGYLYQYSGLIGPKNATVSEKWYDKVKMKIDWFKSQAQTGRADAQFNLGRCYYFGIGVDKDFKQAVHYYRLAAEQGDAYAQKNLGICYKNGQGVDKDFKEAMHYYQLAAEQGNADARNNLGVCYYNGQGVDKDFKQAVHYYQLSAEQGNADAQYNLGVCYYNGQGVDKDFKQAVHYYRLSAEQGNAYAQSNLGFCYYDGQGVVKDFKQAVHYYQLAAEQGNADAQNNLGLCYKNGHGVDKDFKQAVHYYQLTAEQGNATAQYNLGVCYYNGQGVDKDFKQAVHYYKLAAEQGDADAQTNLGVCYYNGQGVDKDFKQAMHYCQLAAEQGNVDAQNNLDTLLKTPPTTQRKRHSLAVTVKKIFNLLTLKPYLKLKEDKYCKFQLT